MVRRHKTRLQRNEVRDTRDRETQEVERLRAGNERLLEQLEEQAKGIADLERQLALKQQNSTITLNPPSSDGLAGQQPGAGAAREEPTQGRRQAGR